MIARLKGLVDVIGDDSAIIDVGGVGYLIFCSARTLSRLPNIGEAVSVEIETHVREDHIHLYGFADAAERDWFRILTGVQGVGSKVGLAILSVFGASELTQVIASGDKTAIAKANGVGPKLAGRIALELKDKVAHMALAPIPSSETKTTSGASEPSVGTSMGKQDAAVPPEDAVSALVNLGFERVKAFGAIADASRNLGPGASLDDLIRYGLKELTP